MTGPRAPTVRRAVVPAAGRGTRMQQLAGDGPKELLPVGGVPMIFYALTDLVAAGIDEIIVVTARAKADIERALQDACDGGDSSLRSWIEPLAACTMRFVTQAEPLGLAHAVACAGELLEEEPFVLFLPDNVFVGERGVTAQLLGTFQHVGETTLGMVPVNAEAAARFGNCGSVAFEEGRDGAVRITRLGDKGTGSFSDVTHSGWRTCGASIQTAAFLQISAGLEANAKGEWDDVPVFQRLAQAGRLYGRRLTDTTCFDAGNPAGYAAADARAVLPPPADAHV